MASVCLVCGAAEAGHAVAVYRVNVCTDCYQKAVGGWPKSAEPALFAALARQGLLIPDRNDADLIPRSYAPPADFAL